jgi:hypothetical protein
MIPGAILLILLGCGLRVALIHAYYSEHSDS